MDPTDPDTPGTDPTDDAIDLSDDAVAREAAIDLTDHAPEGPATQSATDLELARAVGQAGSDRPSREDVIGLLSLVARSARDAGAGAVANGRWLTDIMMEASGHLAVRDLATLQAHHQGLDGRLLADALVRNASIASATVGGITGAMAAASQLTPATWATMPMELLGETLVVVAIEMKLVAELHEAAHRPVEGTRRERGLAIAQAWSETRGIRPNDLMRLPLHSTAADLLSVQSRSTLANHLRRRLIRRAGRNLTTFAPFLAGAAAGAELNRRATRKLGIKVADSLGIRPPR